jgi:hypothetical protein
MVVSEIGIVLSYRMSLLMVKKCTKAALDAVVMEVRWLVTETVMRVQGAANLRVGVTKG